MLTDKTTQVRDHVLSLLEQDKLDAGEKIPGARDLAADLGISFPKVQNALDTLVQDGILESRGRTGTFVQRAWRKRILHENISIFQQRQYLPWLNGLQEIMRESIPGLRFTHTFRRGMLELRTTLTAQQEFHNYLDLSDILDECYPDRSSFFEHIFNPFYINGRLVGIPFSFSPRVMFVNPKLFQWADCPVPAAGWTWDTFMACIPKLRKILPHDRVLNFHAQPYYWLNYVMRSGGRLFNPDNPETMVNVDSEETRAGIRLFCELGEALDWPEFHGKPFYDDFARGKAAMIMAGRQFLNLIREHQMEDWTTVPLPVFPNGQDVTSQSTDVLCIRESCTNMALAREYIKMMLSEQVQDYIAQQKYSIPIRKSSAFKSIDLTDPRDSLFAVEMGKLGIERMIEYPMLAELVTKGVDYLIKSQGDIELGTKELADAARVYLRVQKHTSETPSPEIVAGIA